MAVEYTEEVASRAAAWLAHSTSKRRTRENIAELHALYALISGQSAAGCVSCGFSHYVDLLTAYVRHFQRLADPTIMADSQYSIAPGLENETFVHENYSEAITADNLTDKAAEFFIKNGYEHAFVKKEKPTTGPSTPKLTEKQQAVADYKELFGADADEKLTAKELQALIADKRTELSKQD